MVKDLTPDSGASQVAYISGFQSKVLVQINIHWGGTTDSAASWETVIFTANILRHSW